MYTLELSDQMMSVIATALGNHPYREAAPVIMELQRQLNAQRQMNGGQQPSTEQRDNVP